MVIFIRLKKRKNKTRSGDVNTLLESREKRFKTQQVLSNPNDVNMVESSSYSPSTSFVPILNNTTEDKKMLSDTNDSNDQLKSANKIFFLKRTHLRSQDDVVDQIKKAKLN